MTSSAHPSLCLHARPSHARPQLHAPRILPPPYTSTRTHTRTHTRAHTRTHTRTRAHTPKHGSYTPAGDVKYGHDRVGGIKLVQVLFMASLELF